MQMAIQRGAITIFYPHCTICHVFSDPKISPGIAGISLPVEDCVFQKMELLEYLAEPKQNNTFCSIFRVVS